MLRGAGRRNAALRYTFLAPAGQRTDLFRAQRQANGNRLIRRGAALFIEIVQRHQHVGFRIIGADGARR